MGSAITALILGIIPFFVFVGTTSSTTINGVTDSSTLNILGLVLGIIGLVIALRTMFRPVGPVAVVVAVLAAVVCVAAILNSIGYISIVLV